MKLSKKYRKLINLFSDTYNQTYSYDEVFSNKKYKLVQLLMILLYEDDNNYINITMNT